MDIDCQDYSKYSRYECGLVLSERPRSPHIFRAAISPAKHLTETVESLSNAIAPAHSRWIDETQSNPTYLVSSALSLQARVLSHFG